MRVQSLLNTDNILTCLPLFSKIFPGSATARGPILTDTPLARIRAILDAEEKAAAAIASAGQEATDGVDGGEDGEVPPTDS